MERQIVPIQYGLKNYPDGYLDAKAIYFPHGWEYVNGGCFVQRQKETQIYVCPECKKAEKAFMQIWLKGFVAGIQFYREELEEGIKTNKPVEPTPSR
jgi:virulence-associated protein VapD